MFTKLITFAAMFVLGNASSLDQMIVSVPKLALRIRFDPSSKRVCVLEQGTRITVVKRKGSAIQVISPENQKGWIDQNTDGKPNVMSPVHAQKLAAARPTSGGSKKVKKITIAAKIAAAEAEASSPKVEEEETDELVVQPVWAGRLKLRGKTTKVLRRTGNKGMWVRLDDPKVSGEEAERYISGKKSKDDLFLVQYKKANDEWKIVWPLMETAEGKQLKCFIDQKHGFEIKDCTEELLKELKSQQLEKRGLTTIYEKIELSVPTTWKSV